MATIVVPSLDPLITAIYNDPDKDSYGEKPTAKETEIRAANASVGTGALLARLLRAGGLIYEAQRSKLIEHFDATTGWTAGTGTHVLSADAAVLTEGAAALKVAVTSQTASTTVIDHGPARNVGTTYMDLSAAGITAMTVQCRASSITNLSAVRVYFYFSGNDANFAYFAVTPTVINVWQQKTLTKATPTATGGTVNWAQVHKISVGIVSTATAYTGNVYLDDLRADPLMVYESTYDMGIRYRDVANFGTRTWKTVKLSQPPTAVLVSPADASTVTDPTTTRTSTYSSPAGKAKKRSVWKTYQRVGGVDQEIHSVTVEGTAVTDTLPAGVQTQTGAVIAWDVEHEDSDGLKTLSPRWTYTTSFSAPAPITALTATPDAESSSVVLGWVASVGPNVNDHRVYWRNGAGENLLVATLAATATTYTHLGARPGANEYLVSAHTGANESESLLVEAELPAMEGGSGAFVREGDERHTVAFRVGGAPRTRDAGVERDQPPGRGTPVHRKWGVAGRSVSVSIKYLPIDEGDMAGIFDELLGALLPGWLKLAAGFLRDPLWCEVVDVSDAIEAAGWVTMTVGFEETDPP